MSYHSVVETIWARLKSEGSVRRPVTSRATFDNVCEAFYQAEHAPPPHSEVSTWHVKMYRAEWNIHAYYCKAPYMISIRL